MSYSILMPSQIRTRAKSTMHRLKWKKGEVHFFVQRWHMCGPHPGVLHTHHEFTEAFWIEEGECIHLINGSRVPLAQGSLVMVREHDLHGYDNETKDGFL